MKDLTPQEAVREARKIIGGKYYARVTATHYFGRGKDKGNLEWTLFAAGTGENTYYNTYAPTLRSCLAKLKKGVA